MAAALPGSPPAYLTARVVNYESSAETIDAFEMFLQSFYPQEGMSGNDWESVRAEFYELHDVDESNIDWEAYREAIGY